jgi:hypothetical protein
MNGTRIAAVAITICIANQCNLALAQAVMNPIILDDQPLDDQPAPPRSGVPTDQGSPYRPGGSSPVTPDPQPQPRSVEYVGFYGCGQGPTALHLRITKNEDDGSQRATFSFGPLPLNPNVESGEFLMSGYVDLENGFLSLYPVRWLDRPPGYMMVGLRGTSSNHGYNFEGEVTGGPGCGYFSVNRSR